MKFTDNRAISFCRMICALTVGFFILFSFNLSAYAYDENYVGNSKYWNDKGEIVNISVNDCQGCFKYIVDKENGCVYCYLSFYDLLLTEKSADVSLLFKIKNSDSYYSFSVSKDGVNADEINIIEKSFNVYYDFSKVNSKYHGGELFVAFEFKNSADKGLNNNVCCEYSCGEDNDFVIIKDIAVNMEKATTVKATTEKTAKETTEKSTTVKTTKQSTSNNSASSTVKSTTSSAKNTTEKSTKFVPSNTKKGSASSIANAKYTTKFSAEKADSIGEEEVAEGSVQPYEADSFAPDDLTSDGGLASVQTEKEKSSADRRTTSSKILFAFGITVFALGTFLVLYGVLKGRYKVIKADDFEEKSETDLENTL